MAGLALAEPVPLAADGDGVLRVGGTRVPLETVVEAFRSGATAEEIARDFPVLRLDDIYSVITYYLRHRSEVEEYSNRRQIEAGRIRREILSDGQQVGLRERLLARLPR